MEHILMAIVAGIVALVVTRCGAGASTSDVDEVDAVPVATIEESTTTTTSSTTTTTSAPPRSATTVAVAPVLETEDPNAIAYCFATALVNDVLATGVRGEIHRVRAAIESRAEIMRTLVPPSEIASDLEITLATADAVSALLGDERRTLDDKQDELELLMSGEAFQASRLAIEAFERDICLLD